MVLPTEGLPVAGSDPGAGAVGVVLAMTAAEVPPDVDKPETGGRAVVVRVTVTASDPALVQPLINPATVTIVATSHLRPRRRIFSSRVRPPRQVDPPPQTPEAPRRSRTVDDGHQPAPRSTARLPPRSEKSIRAGLPGRRGRARAIDVRADRGGPCRGDGARAGRDRRGPGWSAVTDRDAGHAAAGPLSSPAGVALSGDEEATRRRRWRCPDTRPPTTRSSSPPSATRNGTEPGLEP